MKKVVATLFVLSFIVLFATCSFSEEKNNVSKKTIWNKLVNIFKTQENKPKQLPKADVVTEDKPISKPEIQKKQDTKHPVAEFTKEEVVERIKYMVEITPEVKDFIPELKIERDKDDRVVNVKYSIDGVPTDLNDIDKETLMKIHGRIASERTRMQTERIQKQLQSLAQTQRAIQQVNQIPKTYVAPPRVPIPPKAPASPPKVYVPPPAPSAPPRR